MIRIQTQTSVYLFRGDGHYLRMPAGEREREPEEQLMQAISGGPMDDNEWKPVVMVKFRQHPHPDWADANPSLRIIYPGADTGIIRSMTRATSHRTRTWRTTQRGTARKAKSIRSGEVG